MTHKPLNTTSLLSHKPHKTFAPRHYCNITEIANCQRIMTHKSLWDNSLQHLITSHTGHFPEKILQHLVICHTSLKTLLQQAWQLSATFKHVTQMTSPETILHNSVARCTSLETLLQHYCNKWQQLTATLSHMAHRLKECSATLLKQLTKTLESCRINHLFCANSHVTPIQYV